MTPGGPKVPHFVTWFLKMIDKTLIEKLVNEYIAGTDIFIVDVKISSAGKINIFADKHEGITVDECAGINKMINNNLDRNVEDYELTVSSPGIDMPFLVIQQYYKNEGKRIEVTDIQGNKYHGILKNVNKGGFELLKDSKSKQKGKDKQVDITEISFNFDQVKSARETLIF